MVQREWYSLSRIYNNNVVHNIVFADRGCGKYEYENEHCDDTCTETEEWNIKNGTH